MVAFGSRLHLGLSCLCISLIWTLTLVTHQCRLKPQRITSMKSFLEENKYVPRGMLIYLTVGHSMYSSFPSCGFGYVYSSLFVMRITTTFLISHMYLYLSELVIFRAFNTMNCLQSLQLLFDLSSSFTGNKLRETGLWLEDRSCNIYSIIDSSTFVELWLLCTFLQISFSSQEFSSHGWIHWWLWDRNGLSPRRMYGI